MSGVRLYKYTRLVWLVWLLETIISCLPGYDKCLIVFFFFFPVESSLPVFDVSRIGTKQRVKIRNQYRKQLGSARYKSIAFSPSRSIQSKLNTDHTWFTHTCRSCRTHRGIVDKIFCPRVWKVFFQISRVTSRSMRSKRRSCSGPNSRSKWERKAQLSPRILVRISETWSHFFPPNFFVLL